MKFELANHSRFTKLTTLDAHTEGEPLRIVTSGYPTIPGSTILEKRQYVTKHLDHLRKVLMFEPRGHADMYGAIITEPVSPDSSFGILFMHNEGYSSMCGHAIIATVSAAIECNDIKLADNETKVVLIDSPAGQITAYASKKDGKPNVYFDCVRSYVEVCDRTITIPGFGNVTYDIAFGGAYYAYVDADIHNIDCSPNNVEQLITLGRSIKQAVANSYDIEHPEHQDLSFLYGTIFTSKKTTDASSHSRHVCIFADGEVDRSPTGTGVSARAALLHHKGEVALNQTITIESIISSKMTVSATKQARFNGKDCVIPRVSGSAFITGVHQFLVDEYDPLKAGFILR
ncbi:proline racemase family protein [Thalassotalea sp. M1531]|uniref:trans-L-3-hydroxyproline dehydratase n=1 Tax=Thalassotalea algicola TaxID=2716224 RepID=A0A7Y0Q9Q7_9GAMM|nr:proline racemase family protein [Thalassotalea algicola]NMP33455.1 proline racemase family protein [Thalassotalea algicola]